MTHLTTLLAQAPTTAVAHVAAELSAAHGSGQLRLAARIVRAIADELTHPEAIASLRDNATDLDFFAQEHERHLREDMEEHGEAA